jgi:hypothetical protein
MNWEVPYLVTYKKSEGHSISLFIFILFYFYRFWLITS